MLEVRVLLWLFMIVNTNFDRQEIGSFTIESIKVKSIS